MEMGGHPAGKSKKKTVGPSAKGKATFSASAAQVLQH